MTNPRLLLEIRTLGRPVTINQERKAGRWTRAHNTRLWRTAAREMIAELSPAVPFVGPVAVVVTPCYADRRSMPDVGAVAPSAKAVVDGVVDGGLLVGDGPRYVVRVTYESPDVVGWDGLRVELVGVGSVAA